MYKQIFLSKAGSSTTYRQGMQKSLPCSGLIIHFKRWNRSWLNTSPQLYANGGRGGRENMNGSTTSVLVLDLIQQGSNDAAKLRQLTFCLQKITMGVLNGHSPDPCIRQNFMDPVIFHAIGCPQHKCRGTFLISAGPLNDIIVLLFTLLPPLPTFGFTDGLMHPAMGEVRKHKTEFDQKRLGSQRKYGNVMEQVCPFFGLHMDGPGRLQCFGFLLPVSRASFIGHAVGLT